MTLLLSKQSLNFLVSKTVVFKSLYNALDIILKQNIHPVGSRINRDFRIELPILVLLTDVATVLHADDTYQPSGTGGATSSNVNLNSFAADHHLYIYRYT